MLRTLSVISLFLLFSCNANRDEMKAKSQIPAAENERINSEMGEVKFDREELAPEAMTSLAAKAVMFDSLHKFVKTADLSFRAKEVVKTMLDIEKLTAQNDGFVESSDLRTEEIETHVVPLNDDFNKEIKKFTTVSSLTVRVPSENLNGFLLSLQPFVEHPGHRNVTATNIAFDQYLKKMIRYRISSHSLRVLSGKPKAADLDQLLERELQSDREQIEDMKLDEQVKFSTVHLQISGPEQLTSIKVPAISVEAYKPSFGDRFAGAISTGWNAAVVIFVLLVSIWPLLLAAGLVVYFIRKKRKNKKAALTN